jgi:hypothetical protein
VRRSKTPLSLPFSPLQRLRHFSAMAMEMDMFWVECEGVEVDQKKIVRVFLAEFDFSEVVDRRAIEIENIGA